MIPALGLALAGLAGCAPVVDTDTWTPDTDVDWTPGDPVAYCEVLVDDAEPMAGTLSLSGRNSYDPAQKGIASYAWTLRSAPVGSSAVIRDASASNASIDVDVAGTYLAELVVTATDGRVSAPCSIPAHAAPTESLWIELTWALANDDLDLHLLRADGAIASSDDCWHLNCEGVGGRARLTWGSPSDLDDPILLIESEAGRGPEITEIPAPAADKYTIAVTDVPTLVEDAPNDATVRVYIDGALATTLTRSIVGESDAPTYFATIDYPSKVITPCEPSGC